MSASLVRKSLDISSESHKSSKFANSFKKSIKKLDSKSKRIEAKKKEKRKLEKQNLKILLALDPHSKKSSSKNQVSSNNPEISVKKKKKGKKSKAFIPFNSSDTSKDQKTVFTEEDFKKFESEYFVTE